MNHHPDHSRQRPPADEPAPRRGLLPVLLVAQLMVILVGIAVLVTMATAGGDNAIGPTGIDHAFLAAGAAAALGGVLALIVLPPARSFLPMLRLSPTTMPIH